MPKDIRFITKRRKNQLIRSRILFYSINNSGSAKNNCALENEISNNNSLENNSTHYSTSVIEDNPSCNFPICKMHISNLQDSAKSIDNEISGINNNLDLNKVNSESQTSDKSASTLRDKLSLWVMKENITQKSVNTLLQILRDYGGHDTLPRDARTLMHTPKQATQEIKKIAGGSYIHFGVMDGLLRSITKYFKVCPSIIDILINVDGLSISNSSTSQFWPILISIFNIRTKPFVAGVYHGMSKPNDANQYLNPLINELTLLEEHGINYNGKICKILVKGIVCDAPARAFITFTKNHSGYFGCSKCVQEGEYINSVIFPEFNCALRTDKSFRQKEQEEHHTGTSILESLKINMVSQVALDYMQIILHRLF